MLATASYTLPDEPIGMWPNMFWIMNRLEVARKDMDNIFIHKRVEYTGVLRLISDASALVRICIVQPRQGGELQFANRANTLAIFGTENPTVATPIQPEWIGISDRHYLLDPTNRSVEIDYSHRLSHNLSLHRSTFARYTHIAVGPMFWCAISDVHNAVLMHHITLRTIGTVDTVENPIDELNGD